MRPPDSSFNRALACFLVVLRYNWLLQLNWNQPSGSIYFQLQYFLLMASFGVDTCFPMRFCCLTRASPDLRCSHKSRAVIMNSSIHSSSNVVAYSYRFTVSDLNFSDNQGNKELCIFSHACDRVLCYLFICWRFLSFEWCNSITYGEAIFTFFGRPDQPGPLIRLNFPNLSSSLKVKNFSLHKIKVKIFWLKFSNYENVIELFNFHNVNDVSMIVSK